jgi:predicted nucleic acid-binding protein
LASLVEAATIRKRTGRKPTTEFRVPTTVRAESGWDRTSPAAAFIDRLGITDDPLDTHRANDTARLVNRYGVSVPDAHLGASIQHHTGPDTYVTVVTSDRSDIRRVAETANPTVVTL